MKKRKKGGCDKDLKGLFRRRTWRTGAAGYGAADFSALHICLKHFGGKKRDLFSFFLSSFTVLISQQHGVSTFYILSVVKGECVLFLSLHFFFGFLVVYKNIFKAGVLKKYLWHFVENKS